ncbi:DUF21 domain-containing protein [Corynebacterium poyangense]|uniref:DUF21 domain-containing protein n=1 Tax=Corynebacterium poyangense TaxID=2684405 RepID=A0A7H0SNR7_9CORY|nr:hemolysin family protein [Corynebacterium poyangense]QNQ90192.1 DUF21 domain-containing protein [Corynebacterium poyangense]
MSIFTTILLIGALLLGNAFFVAGEFAMISSRRDRLESLISQGKSSARKALFAVEHLSIVLAGMQLGITICSLILGKVAEPAIAHYIEEPFTALGVPSSLIHPISFVIALVIITFLHILFGEMVPKNIAIAGPETLAMWLAPGVILWMKLTRPGIEFMNWSARITLKLFGIEQKDELDSTVDQEQLASMIAESRSEGLLDAEEHARLSKALKSENRSVKEVMIPTDQVRCIPNGKGGPLLLDLEKAVVETGFSRFPVRAANSSYVGYVHIKDVLDRIGTASAQDRIPAHQIRPLIIVQSDAAMDEALHKLHLKSAHMAQVRDHSGKLLGIITLEDLIEEYVGTVSDWTHEQT